MSGPASPNGQDPNMEDILASIRRILNEDEPVAAAAPAKPAAAAMGAPPAPAPAPAPALAHAPAPVPAARAAAPLPGEDEDPLELTEAMMVSPPPAAPVPEFRAELPPAAPPASVPMNVPPAMPAGDASLRDALLAPATAAATAAALGELARAVSAERTAHVTRSGPTIEDVVRDEVRPVVKAWLDNHLPSMVERMVRAEIQRLVGGSLG